MSAYLAYLANYLAIRKLQGMAKRLNFEMNMRVTLHTLQFSQLQSQPLSLPLHSLRPICVDVSDKQLRDALPALRRELEDCKVHKVQGENLSRPRGSSISLQGARCLQGKSKRVERQTPPTAEILEPLGRCFSWLARRYPSNLRLVL
jgi:hypothetical protein